MEEENKNNKKLVMIIFILIALIVILGLVITNLLSQKALLTEKYNHLEEECTLVQNYTEQNQTYLLCSYDPSENGRLNVSTALIDNNTLAVSCT